MSLQDMVTNNVRSTELSKSRLNVKLSVFQKLLQYWLTGGVSIELENSYEITSNS